LIFTGVFLFHFFSQYFNPIIELIFNVTLIFFLIHFIYTKVKSHYKKINFNKDLKNISALNISFKTLAFTYLNPHVYSDTVFFLGNFSKNFLFNQKILFGIGASIASFIFFYSIGYLSKYLSKYAQSHKMWKIINIFIITLMSLLILYIIVDIFS
jgi:L-lysine exporter family protein LysE/ArgO